MNLISMVSASIDSLGGQAGALSALWFFLAILLLDFFDIALPRGDSMAVSGALCAAAMVILGPFVGGGVAVLSLLLVYAARFSRVSVRRASQALSARIGAVGVASLAMLLMGSSTGILGYARIVVVSTAFLLTDLVLNQVMMAVQTKRPFGRLLAGSLRMQGMLLLAQGSAAVLVYITYPEMNAWSLIPVVAILLLTRQSYALLLDIRETYRKTVEVLVQAAEGEDVRRTGHAERTAGIARAIAMKAGLTGDEVERVSYAALLHDLDALGEAVPSDGHAVASPASATGGSADVVADSVFFADVVPVLRVCDGDAEFSRAASSADLTSAFIVSLASDVDAEEHPDVAEAHTSSSVSRVYPFVTAAEKARIVGAAIEMGYRIPAVG